MLLLWERVFVLLNTLVGLGRSLENAGLRSTFSLHEDIDWQHLLYHR